MAILSSGAEKSRARILSIDAEGSLQVKLIGYGLGRGADVEILRNRGGDVVLSNGNNRISLGRSISSRIQVEAIAEVN